MGWGTLAEIARANAAEIRAELTDEPVDCPNDGTPLVRCPDGGLVCPWDGWSTRFSRQSKWAPSAPPPAPVRLVGDFNHDC